MITVLLTFCQDLTCLKPDLQQTGSATTQTMCHTIQTPRDVTVRTVQNPFTTVQLFQEYGQQVQHEILNIC